MAVDVGTALIAGSAAGALVSVVLAVGAWYDRAIPGAVPFGWLMVAATGWCLLNIVWLATTDPTVAAGTFLGIQLSSGAIVGLWVVFALVYTGRRDWLTRPRLAALLLIPNGYTALALTAPLYSLTTLEPMLVTLSGETAFVARTGLVLDLQNATSVLFIAGGYALFGEFLLRSRNLYRKQTFVILTAGLLTAGAQGLFVLGASPHPGLDITPVTFALNGFLVGFVLFRYDFVSVTPLAGDLLVDELPDPLLVLDPQETVIDYNSAAAELFGEPALEGEHVDDVSPGLLEDIERGQVVTLGEPMSYFDPRTRAIRDQHDTVRGRLVVLREVTGQQRRQERLEALQAASRQFIRADSPDIIAELSVDYATRVLDQDAVGMFLHTDDGVLEPAAVSDVVEAATTPDSLVVDPEATPDHEFWRAYDARERQVVRFEGAGPLETALVIPMRDHGLFAIGLADGDYGTETKQYAEILAYTAEAALEQVSRQWELKESQTSVERRNDQIEFFNGVLRHSLRNAMLVVQGRAEYLQGTVDDEYRSHLDSIVTWCGKLSEMSDTIRDINQTVSASETERLEPVSLTGTVREAVDATASDGTAVTVGLGNDRVLANALAEKVVATVVENAIEHNTSDQQRIEIGAQHAGDWVQLRIADNGPGISDELKTKVFERSISPDQTAGGFGLYFVSVMMGLYGGKVWYEDNDPCGAVAVLEFQRAEDDGETDLGPNAYADGVPAGKAQGKSADN